MPDPPFEIPARPVVDAMRKVDDEFNRIFEKVWSAHKKQIQSESKQSVYQILLGEFLDGRLDIALMEARHGPYAEYWRRNDWRFCPLTLLGWFRNGMEPPAENPEPFKRGGAMRERLSLGGRE